MDATKSGQFDFRVKNGIISIESEANFYIKTGCQNLCSVPLSQGGGGLRA